ncbi:MAG: amino acid-binding protein [Spirochaetota bacterium]
MIVKQISVFMENKPGHLENILKVLADNDINVLTVTVADMSNFGILRLIVNDLEKAKSVFKKANITCSVTDLLAVELSDKPGALCKAIQAFTKHSLNIEYIYTFGRKSEDNGVMLFRFEDIEAAKKAISAEGYKIIKTIEIYGK